MSAADWRAGALAVLAELRAELDQNAAEEDAADLRVASSIPVRLGHAHRAEAFRQALKMVDRVRRRLTEHPSPTEDIGERTPYQRGNRDGLTNLAAELDEMASRAREQRDHHRAVDAKRPVSDQRMTIHASAEQQAYAQVAALARRRADALPIDPEEDGDD